MEARKITSPGFRDGVLLDNGQIRAVIDTGKGMIPELSIPRGAGRTNAHWQPWFRANSGVPWNEKDHAPFWQVPLLYDIAGNFPCIPNFGPGHRAAGYEMPPHGHTAREEWRQENPRCSEDKAELISHLKPADHPFRYKKTDILWREHSILYTRLDVENTGPREEPFNAGWHNTVGPPFLESGCLIDNNAERFAIPGKGTEFDDTGCLALEGRSDSMSSLPLRSGGTIDLRQVPGITGYADFVTAAVPPACTLAWSSVVNPRTKELYLSFFTGPAALSRDEIPLYFYDYWLNYGGRPFKPWAIDEGTTDLTFCLGAENGTGCFANGLADCLDHPELLGNPTYLLLQPGERKSLYYGTLFSSYEGTVLDKGVKEVNTDGKKLILTGYDGGESYYPADPGFCSLKG